MSSQPSPTSKTPATLGWPQNPAMARTMSACSSPRWPQPWEWLTLTVPGTARLIISATAAAQMTVGNTST